MSFIDVLLRQLEEHPDRAFVTEVHGERLEATRGGRLREMVARARRQLRALGLRPGDRVVLVASNSARWVAADLAMLAEGLTSVPLYARQAPAELCRMIDASDPSLVVVEHEGLHDALRHGAPAVPRRVLDALFTALPSVDGSEAPRGADAPSPVGTEHPVTIIFTSGSSGEPKGVLTTVRNVETMLPILDAKLREMMGEAPGSDRVFHYLPLCFSGSRMVLWASLFRGNGLHLSTSLEDLRREMATARPHYFLNVPALLERVRTGVEAGIAGRPLPIRALYRRTIEAFRRHRKGASSAADHAVLFAARKALFPAIRAQVGPDLKCLICGSAPLSDETQAWFSDLLGIPVYQVYGLTETTAIVSIDPVGGAVPGRVGHPIAPCELKLAADGELLVRGPSIFPGYFRAEAATREAFDDEGWFHTGDQAHLDERGSLAIIGRVKNLLVPSSGHNVAPEPIEQALVERLQGVGQAVVVGHGRPFLVAILTGTAERAAVDAALEGFNAELPHYRRIRKYVLRAEPLTPENGLLTANQKVRRKAIEAHFARDLEALYR